MGEGESAPPQEEPPKKSRHRRKHFYNTILLQMEFYFSDSNLSKDRFLSQLLTENKEIDIETFLKFNKIRKLNCTIDDIQKALTKSELIGLSEDGKKVHRKKPIKIKENVDFCTIYVENIKADASHESLSQIFSDFGKVVYVSIPKYKHNKGNKGFAFIEYETEEQAREAIAYFESIGCKIPAEKSPEELQSIVAFEGDQEGNMDCDNMKSKITEQENIKEPEESKVAEIIGKRKLNIEDEAAENTKRQKLDNMKSKITEQENIKEPEESEVAEKIGKRKLSIENEAAENTKSQKLEEKPNEQLTEEVKKRKHKKKDKRRHFFKELGLQVLSKKEWKRLRNQYLQLQRKKMKEFKQYLHRQKYGPKYEEFADEEHQEVVEQTPAVKEEEISKLTYIPGVIVKLHLSQPCNDVKKLKNDIKSAYTEAKYVDIPLPAGSEEVFIRFNNTEAAIQFTNSEFEGEKTLINGEEEKAYWQKIETDRTVKFKKTAKKQRGRDKLLKKAEKESAKHMRFEDESLNVI